MRKKLKVNVSKDPKTDGVISCKNLSVRERLLNFLFGNKRRVTILIPGDGVDEISISGEKEGGNQNE